MPNLTEILFELGLADRLAGVTSFCDYPAEVKAKEKIGGLLINWEKVVTLKPDLMIFLAGGRPQEEDRARQLRLRVLVVKMDTAADLLESLEIIGRATGRQEQARALNRRLSREVWRIKVRQAGIGQNKKLRVYVWLGGQPLIAAGPGTFINELVGLAGGASITGRLKGKYPQVSWEFLLKEDPDVIVAPDDILKSADDLKKFKFADKLRAVQQGRVLIMDGDILTRPSPRFTQALEQLFDYFYEPVVKN